MCKVSTTEGTQARFQMGAHTHVGCQLGKTGRGSRVGCQLAAAPRPRLHAVAPASAASNPPGIRVAVMGQESGRQGAEDAARRRRRHAGGHAVPRHLIPLLAIGRERGPYSLLRPVPRACHRVVLHA
jgi:hypothetical protein